MKFDKLFIIIVLLMVIFTLSAVNAENGEDIAINETTVGNFDELASEIQNTNESGTLILEKDYRFESGSADGILIDKAITIDGQGHTVDGANSSRIFNLYFENYTYKTVTFKNLTFLNGRHDKNGAAIFLHGNSIVEDEIATENYLVLKDCTFIGNHAKIGGAVSCSSVSSIRDCTFTNNSAADSGGAIFSSGKTTIGNCNFEANDAKFGGAVDWMEGSIHDSNFTKNNASRGGALYYYGSGSLYSYPSAGVSNCIFDRNVASLAGAIFGAGNRYAGSLSVDSSLFTNNAAEQGGALLFTGSIIDGGTADLSKCTFRNNSASIGGAVSVGSIMPIEYCVFEENHASKGGAIYVADHYREKTSNSTFIRNFADEGAAAYSEISSYCFINCTFDNNIAAGNGSVVYGANVTGCKFINSSEKPMPVKIIASPITTVYNGGKYIVATIKDGADNPLADVNVTIKISSITKTMKTNDAGQVKLTTDGLAPKTSYTATITFDGNDKYEKATKSVKVTVKKANPKLTAKAKTFKRSDKSKKYSVTLKTNQNKVMKNTKITIKVNKKTYTTKTNSKGVATFKLNKLTKKGKYSATVKYAGDKYYNAKSATKIKITVK